mmetsp:Transcript_38832/g.84541  ORF Transcript_38832/g.84541 Transcript_38832/m.84541 type:complete len:202 (-) Transcript_38832:446-1051(-)
MLGDDRGDLSCRMQIVGCGGEPTTLVYPAPPLPIFGHPLELPTMSCSQRSQPGLVPTVPLDLWLLSHARGLVHLLRPLAGGFVQDLLLRRSLVSAEDYRPDTPPLLGVVSPVAVSGELEVCTVTREFGALPLLRVGLSRALELLGFLGIWLREDESHITQRQELVGVNDELLLFDLRRFAWIVAERLFDVQEPIRPDPSLL